MAGKIASIVWGGIPYEITQEHGIPGFRPDWYKYSETLGFPAGYHLGLDVPVPRGTPIKAAGPGKVIQEGFSNSFRPYPVWIEYDDNPVTPTINEKGMVGIYGHLMAENVALNQTVRAGQVIGLSGEQTYKGTDTPDGSGAHIHYELRQPDSGTASGYRAIDPRTTLTGTPGLGEQMDVNIPIVGDAIEKVFADATERFRILLRRFFFVAIGLVLLYLGVSGLLKTHTNFRGINAKGIVRKLPVGRVAKAVA